MNMLKFLPPRLRAPVLMLAGGAVICAVAVIGWGWRSLISLGPVTIISVVGYYVLGGRDSDFAAMLREQADERQEYRRHLHHRPGRHVSRRLAGLP